MFRRFLSALGLRKKPVPTPPKKSSALLRLQRQSAFTAVDFEKLKEKRRGEPPR